MNREEIKKELIRFYELSTIEDTLGKIAEWFEKEIKKAELRERVRILKVVYAIQNLDSIKIACELGIEQSQSELDKMEVSEDDVSMCDTCLCMTHTINGKCGKCRADKIESIQNEQNG